MTEQNCEARIHIEPVATSSTKFELLLPNRAYELPAMGIGEPLTVRFSLVGVKSMGCRENGGRMAIELSGYTLDTVIETSAWSIKLPEWEVTHKEQERGPKLLLEGDKAAQ